MRRVAGAPPYRDVRRDERITCLASMSSAEQILVFALDEQRYGLPLASTERVLAALEITPLPHAPPIVSGIFNYHGRIIPVFNVRHRFGRPARAISPDQQFIIARTSGRSVALVVDSTHGVVALSKAERVSSSAVLHDLPYVQGVMRMPDGLVLVHDLETFLSLEEAAALNDALLPSHASAGAR
jgi:purine-binding chemotaxis protein CheW